ncbi:MAG: LysR family transcriptional regulator [Oligoflexales bacterium]
METNRLRQFVALVQTKHLRKAAEAMKTSHGAFHKSLQVLQDELGFPLYLLDGRNIVITPRGQAFYEKARAFLEAEKRLFARETPIQQPLRIATHETFSTYLLAPNWTSGMGDVPLFCRDLLPGRMEEALEQGIVDLGLTYDHIPRAGLDGVRLGRVQMGIFARESLDYPGIENLPFVAPTLPLETVPSAARGLDGWPEASFPRLVVHSAELLSTALAMVGKGTCAIFMPQFVAKAFNVDRPKDKHLVSIPLPRGFKAVYREVYLVQRVGSDTSSAVRNLVKLVKSGIF